MSARAKVVSRNEDQIKYMIVKMMPPQFPRHRLLSSLIMTIIIFPKTTFYILHSFRISMQLEPAMNSTQQVLSDGTSVFRI